MKRFLGMSLVVLLVLVLGSLAMANEPKLEGKITADIPVQATVGPYAQVMTKKGVYFGELLGKADTYTTSGPGVFPGRFEVAANTDVMIDLEVENPAWISSPYKFTIYRAPGSELKGEISRRGDTVNDTCSFEQEYVNYPVGYSVAGEIEIEAISQVEAKEYKTKIVVTVSQL